MTGRRLAATMACIGSLTSKSEELSPLICPSSKLEPLLQIMLRTSTVPTMVLVLTKQVHVWAHVHLIIGSNLYSFA